MIFFGLKLKRNTALPHSTFFLDISTLVWIVVWPLGKAVSLQMCEQLRLISSCIVKARSCKCYSWGVSVEKWVRICFLVPCWGLWSLLADLLSQMVAYLPSARRRSEAHLHESGIYDRMSIDMYSQPVVPNGCLRIEFRPSILSPWIAIFVIELSYLFHNSLSADYCVFSVILLRGFGFIFAPLQRNAFTHEIHLDFIAFHR